VNPGEWIAFAGLAFAVIIQGALGIWWAATVSAEIKDLKQRATQHGEIRDLVVELRAQVKSFATAINQLAEGLKEVRSTPRRRSVAD